MKLDRRVGLLGGVGVVGLAVVISAVERPALAQGPGVIRVAQKVKKKRPTKGATTKPDEPEPTSTKPSAAPTPGDGKLLFSRDVAPLLLANCVGCHNAKPPQARIKLDMSTFEALMKGAPSGKVIEPGKPEESHLVLRIKGEETPKMPPNANQRNISDAAVETIEKWVQQGALLDAGKDPKAKLETYAASPEDLRKAALAKLSAEERDKAVEAVGLDRWKKANPKVEPTVTPSAHFLLFSTLPKDRASSTVKALEAQYTAIKGLLGPASVDWVEKASLFVFNDAISYGEFVHTQQNREIETGDVGTAKMNVPQPYVAVVDPLGGREETPAPASAKKGRTRKAEEDNGPGAAERSLAGLLTEHLTVGTVERMGKPPRWTALGAGALMASRIDGRSAYYTKLRRTAYGLWEQGWISKANDALGDQARAEEVRAVGFAILEWIGAANRGALGPFIQGLSDGGEKLDKVVGRVLNGSREDMLKASGEYIGGRYGALR